MSTCVANPTTPYQFKKSDKWINDDNISMFIDQIHDQLVLDARYIETRLENSSTYSIWLRDDHILRVRLDDSTYVVMPKYMRVQYLLKNISFPVTSFQFEDATCIAKVMGKKINNLPISTTRAESTEPTEPTEK